jgi:hypothetical protein
MSEKGPLSKEGTFHEIIRVIDICDKGTFILIRKRDVYGFIAVSFIFGIFTAIMLFKLIYLRI